MSHAPALSLRIVSITPVAADVRAFELADEQGGALPRFSAGSHLVLDLPLPGGTRRNAYSLVSDGDGPVPPARYRIAVRRAEASRGGSAWLHERARPGQTLRASPPANHFPLHGTARLHLLVAGGIGITPILAMARALARQGRAFELHYGFRDTARAALLDEALDGLPPGTVHAHDASRGRRVPLRELVQERPLGTHLHVCGPAGMIDAARAATAAAGWPPSAFHCERFGAETGGEPFVARLARDGRRLPVPADASLLDTLLAAGVELPHLCRAGVCGECRTKVVAGAPLHRDQFLDDEDRARGDCLMPCVSRASGELVLDL